MRKSTLSIGLWCAASCVAFGQVNIDSQTFTANEWNIINKLSPLPDLPVDTTNKYRDSAAAALLGQKLFFEPRLSGPIQTGTPQEGQLGAIGEKYKIACRNCHMPESKWLFDIRSNNGGPIPNATALGSAWMTRNVSSVVNTVFYVHPRSGRPLARERWLLRFGMVRRAKRAGRAAGAERQPPATGARDLRALPRRLQRRVSRVSADARAGQLQPLSRPPGRPTRTPPIGTA